MSHPPRIYSPEELDLEARLTPLLTRLPEAERVIDGFGHITWKVAGKTFIFIGGHGGTAGVSIKVDKAEQAALIAAGAATRTAYIGQHGWVDIDARPDTDWAELEERIALSFWRAAPRRLLKAAGRA